MYVTREEAKAHIENLIGFRVVGLSVSEGEDTLCIHGEAQHALIVTDADCCSQTWFADITGVENLIGHTIQSFEWIEMPESYNVDDGRGRQKTDEAYGIKITTEAGYCDIVYRNSSNGYYGGSASIAWRDGTATDGMKPITEDWSA